MLKLLLPWLLLMLPLPLLIRLLLPPARPVETAGLFIPFADDYRVHDGDGAISAHASRRYLLWLAWLVWSLLLLAAARPQWLGEPIELPVSGRDLMLAVDLSGSMQIEDFRLNGTAVNRLIATKAVASAFIHRREGDRIGLILFGSQAYVQAPLTFDRQTVDELLQESAIGLAGEKTAIGDAIGLAVKRLRQQNSGQRVLILLTDGVNTAGVLKPEETARLAAQSDVHIYTIGIGADEMVVSSFFGNRKVNPSADLDEAMLKRIAQITGGQYFRARDTRQLEEIYTRIDAMEPVERERHLFRPVHALYVWPLSVAILLALMLIFLRSYTRHPLNQQTGGR